MSEDWVKEGLHAEEELHRVVDKKEWKRVGEPVMGYQKYDTGSRTMYVQEKSKEGSFPRMMSEETFNSEFGAKSGK